MLFGAKEAIFRRMQKVFTLLKKPLVYIPLGILLIGIIVSTARGGRAKEPQTVLVEWRDIVQEVSATGRVKASQSADSAFERGGTIRAVYVESGDVVFEGQVLMALWNGDLLAALKAKEAVLEKLLHGTRPEELAVERTKVENARIALFDAEANLADKIRDAYIKSDDAIRGKTDQFFSNPSTNPQFNFQTQSSQQKIDIETGRREIEGRLTAWQSALSDSGASAAEGNLLSIETYLDTIARAINALIATAGLSQTTLDGYKADVASARATVVTAKINLTAAKEKYRAAESARSLVIEQLRLAEAGSRSEDIAAAEAEMESAAAELSKTILRAPFAGVIATQDRRIGEHVAAGAAALSIIGTAPYEIEVNIPEADIAKVKTGDQATITLDAYGSDVLFAAVISRINPGETIIEGVRTYKTTLTFVKDDARIRRGMTANIMIAAGHRENVLAIPARAIAVKGGTKTVRVAHEGEAEAEERAVVTGLRGSDGYIEVLGGLEEGEQILLRQ